MKNLILSSALFFIMILISPFTWADNEKAEFSIHLFQDGLPVADAVLSISSGAFANTDAPMVDVEEATFVWREDSESIGHAWPTGEDTRFRGRLSRPRRRITSRLRKNFGPSEVRGFSSSSRRETAAVLQYSKVLQRSDRRKLDSGRAISA